MKNEKSIRKNTALMRLLLKIANILWITLYHPVNAALFILLLILIMLFSLQFAPQDGWSTVPAIKDLHHYADPPLSAVAKSFGVNWPASATSPESQLQVKLTTWIGFTWSPDQPVSFLPLALAIAIIIFLIFLNKFAQFLQKTMPRLIQSYDPERDNKTQLTESDAPEENSFLTMKLSQTINPKRAMPAASEATVMEKESQEGDSLSTVKLTQTNLGKKSMSDSSLSSTVMEKAENGSQLIDRYEIIDTLGRGAMGVVYKARDPQIGRIVAVKSISAANPSEPEFVIYKQRFMQEAKAAGQMLHSGIVTIYDLTEDKDGHPAMVMEFVDGMTLEKIMSSEERPPFKRCINLLIQAARALDYAHQRGVIHRDIKPANLLVTGNDVVKIADFGVAKLSGSSLTLSGQLLGTPAFMSPEQFTGSAVDGRSDLFSLGAILYWMCTGELPFSGENVTSIGIKVMQYEPVPACQLNPSLPPDIKHVLSRCLAKSPDGRYATANDLANDLEALASGGPLPSESAKANK